MSLVFMAGAQNLKEYNYPDAWGQQGFTLDESRSDAVYVNYSIRNFTLNPENINGEDMMKITLPGNFLPADEGMPDLPGAARYIAIPQGADVQVNIISSRTQTIQNVEIAPSPRIPLDTDNGPLHYEKNAKVYQKDAFYPEAPASISSKKKIRGVDVVRLAVTPWQYNPVTKELIVYHDMKVELSISGGNGSFGDVRYRSSQWESILRNSILNYESLPVADLNQNSKGGQRTPDLEYIIICPDDAGFLAWADTIALFRNKQGIKTGVVTTTEIGGNTISAIENYVNNAYNTWDIPPSAVLLIGDYGSNGNTIVSPIWNSYCVSDNIFADVDNDNLPDIAFARMTAQNTDQLETMVTKFKNYEMDPPTDPDFYNHPITALGWQTERWFQICSETVGGYWKNELGKDPVRINAVYSGSPSGTWSTATNTSTVLAYFGPSGTGYIPATPAELGGWTGGTASGVNNAINSGSFMLQHRDHGWEQGWGEPDYSSSDISGLTNTDLTFVFSINCLTGKYNYTSEVFAEKFHRYKYNGQNSGALGIIAASEVSYSFVNDTYVWGMYDNMWSDFLPDYGTTNAYDDVRPAFANVNGKYYLDQSSWPYNTNNKVVTYMLFHHHGDAYSTVFTEVPQNLTVVHNSVLLSGVTQFDVTADEYATICLSKDGEILGVAQSDGTGTTLLIPAQTPGTLLDLVVTKQNHYRYTAVVEVIPPTGPYVIKDSYILDNGSGSSNPSPGDDMDLSLTMKNVGSEDATNTVVSISSTDNYITLTDATENYGTITAGQSKSITNGYGFSVADSIPDGHMVSLSISSTDGTDVWASSMAFELFAPSLTAGSISIDDAAGNNNGRLDPGETASITVAVSNNGQSSAASVLANLSTTSTDITINTSSADLGTLSPGETDNATFEISISATAQIGSIANFSFEANSGPHYTASKDFSLSIGLIVEDFESGDFSHYNWQTGGNAPWSITTNPVYEGVYGAASGDVSDNQDSELTISLDVTTNDSISFYRKVSSESNYDYLRFYIDGTEMGEWSGTMDWLKVQYPVSAGSHTFKWAYEKDYSQSSGDDAGYVDFIILPPFSTPTASAGDDGEVCQASGYTLSGLATNYTSILWESTGNGIFDDATSLTATYTPGSQDATVGTATLTLNAIGGSTTVSDDMVLTVHPLAGTPDQPTGDAVVCDQSINSTYKTMQLNEPGIMAYIWDLSPASAGTINSTDTSAVVDWDAGFSGLAYVKVKAENNCGEGDYSDAIEVSISEMPETAGTPSGDNQVCQAAQTVEYTTTGANNATSYEWALSPTDAGTITPNGTTATIDWSADFTGDAQLVVSGANACGAGPASDALTISISELPTPIVSGPDASCQNDTIDYSTTENAGCSYEWTVAGGTIVEGGQSHEVRVLWDSFGGCALSVTETIDASGCASTTELYNVAVEASPIPEISGPNSACAMEEGMVYSTTDVSGDSYEWTIIGGTIISGQGSNEITVNWDAAGNGTLELTQTNSNSCHGYAEAYIVAIHDLPVAEAGADASIANGTTTQLNGSATGGSGSYAYHWEPADKLEDPDVSNPTTLALSSTTVFTLSVADNTGGCTGDDQVTITVTGGALAVEVSSDDAAICNGSSTILHALAGGGSGEYTYSWSSDPAGYSSTEQNPEVSPIENTTYFVEVNDGFNSITGQISILVNELPTQYELNGDNSFCEGSAGAVIGLTGSETGVVYTLYKDGGNTGITAEGTGNAISFAPQAVAGTYTVYAKNATTNCTQDMGSEMIVERMNLPVQPEQPQGPELVDLNSVQASSYSIAASPNSSDYIWQLDPATAGTLTVDMTDVTITWDQGYLGTVLLSVQGVNDCGESAASTALSIVVDRLEGIEETSDGVITVYPNPSRGVFTIDLKALTSNNLNIKIINSVGTCVYDANRVKQSSHLLDVDLSNYSDGVYYLIIQQDKLVFTERLLLRK